MHRPIHYHLNANSGDISNRYKSLVTDLNRDLYQIANRNTRELAKAVDPDSSVTNNQTRGNRQSIDSAGTEHSGPATGLKCLVDAVRLDQVKLLEYSLLLSEFRVLQLEDILMHTAGHKVQFSSESVRNAAVDYDIRSNLDDKVSGLSTTPVHNCIDNIVHIELTPHASGILNLRKSGVMSEDPANRFSSNTNLSRNFNFNSVMDKHAVIDSRLEVQKYRLNEHQIFVRCNSKLPLKGANIPGKDRALDASAMVQLKVGPRVECNYKHRKKAYNLIYFYYNFYRKTTYKLFYLRIKFYNEVRKLTVSANTDCNYNESTTVNKPGNNCGTLASLFSVISVFSQYTLHIRYQIYLLSSIKVMYTYYSKARSNHPLRNNHASISSLLSVSEIKMRIHKLLLTYISIFRELHSILERSFSHINNAAFKRIGPNSVNQATGVVLTEVFKSNNEAISIGAHIPNTNLSIIGVPIANTNLSRTGAGTSSLFKQTSALDYKDTSVNSFYRYLKPKPKSSKLKTLPYKFFEPNTQQMELYNMTVTQNSRSYGFMNKGNEVKVLQRSHIQYKSKQLGKSNALDSDRIRCNSKADHSVKLCLDRELEKISKLQRTKH